LHLDDRERAALDRVFDAARPARSRRRRLRSDADVVLVMGIPGAGKSRVAEEYAALGYLRLNRDERGGSLRELADALDDALASGARRIVLDNTYLTRAGRSYAIETAERHRVPARCIWLDTPLAHAQINVVGRLLERHGSLPTPKELRRLARSEPGVLAPTSQMRSLRELEPPSTDEGWASVEHMPFVRTPPARRGRKGVFVAAGALEHDGWSAAFERTDRNAPHLVFDWNTDGTRAALEAAVTALCGEVSEPVEGALCPHGGGPPICWCRPPLPGLPLEFARARGVDPARSTLVGTGAAHRTLAAALGARYVQV
jgi:hypothetical protein